MKGSLMEFYNTVPADAIAELDAWHEAFAASYPTPEELAQERAYWEAMRRQQDHEDYLAAQAEAAAEEAAAEEEAAAAKAAAAAARRRATYRSKRDGLTQDERSLLREPTRYEVEEVGPGQWWASVPGVDAIFAGMKVDGRTLEVVSNTGSSYTCHVEDDYSVTCPCEHAKKMREWGHDGLCKHAAVVVAVADHCRVVKAVQPAAQPAQATAQPAQPEGRERIAA
jgi:hypothetical protein